MIDCNASELCGKQASVEVILRAVDHFKFTVSANSGFLANAVFEGFRPRSNLVPGPALRVLSEICPASPVFPPQGDGIGHVIQQVDAN